MTLNTKLPLLLGREPFTLLTDKGPNPEYPIVGYGAPYEASGKTMIKQFNLEGKNADSGYDWDQLKHAPLICEDYLIFYQIPGQQGVTTELIKADSLEAMVASYGSIHRSIVAVHKLNVKCEVGQTVLAPGLLNELAERPVVIGG